MQSQKKENMELTQKQGYTLVEEPKPSIPEVSSTTNMPNTLTVPSVPQTTETPQTSNTPNVPSNAVTANISNHASNTANTNNKEKRNVVKRIVNPKTGEPVPVIAYSIPRKFF